MGPPPVRPARPRSWDDAPVKLVYSDRYRPDVGGHILKAEVHRRVVDRLREAGLVGASDVVEPEPASWDDLALVHTREYLERARRGAFSTADLALLELPWSPAVEASYLRVTGGTMLAARLALEARRQAAPPLAAAANIGGGLHHAFPARGEGFCVFNDIAVAIRALQRDGAIRRAAVVDADVHQGNGTAAIFGGDPSVFTFSIHQEHNYPELKPPSSLDVGLPDGAGDDEYLGALERALPAVTASRPDLLVYLAGADPYVDDQLGGLRLSLEGLRGRDFMVLSAARDADVPVAIVLSGGYARRMEDTAAIYAAAIEEAIALGA